jgi:hypothetical protein
VLYGGGKLYCAEVVAAKAATAADNFKIRMVVVGFQLLRGSKIKSVLGKRIGAGEVDVISSNAVCSYS